MRARLTWSRAHRFPTDFDELSRVVAALKEGLIAALLVGLWGCASQDRPESRVALNLTTPRDAAMTFVRAIGQGDVATAKAASIGTESQKQWIDALAGLIDGLRSVDAALLKRFGGSAERLDIDLRDSLRPLAQGAESEVAGATINESGPEARLVPVGRPMSIQVPYATQLRKDKGVWKVDLPAVYEQKPQLSVGADSPEMKTYLQAGKALKSVAREIASGQYKTLNAARNAISERMIQLNGQNGGSSSFRVFPGSKVAPFLTLLRGRAGPVRQPALDSENFFLARLDEN